MQNYTTPLPSRQPVPQLQFVAEAFAGNWIAPVGPHVNAFEEEFAELVGVPHAAALTSGTAALHLALLLAGVGRGDEVLVSTLTFSASVNPIRYVGARPVLIDSERYSWNMDPALLLETLERKAWQGKLPKAVVLVHLYGQSADINPILAACERYGVALIEDAAEALGSSYRRRVPGTFGKAGIYSFNGNKIITTSLITGRPHQCRWAAAACWSRTMSNLSRRVPRDTRRRVPRDTRRPRPQARHPSARRCAPLSTFGDWV